jgi:hypothetical protein
MSIKFSYAVIILLATLLSCQKSSDDPIISSSLTIVNALPGSAALVPNFNSDKTLIYYRTAQTIAANSATIFSGYIGEVPLALSQLTDTTHTVFKQRINIEPGAIKSLFVVGTLENPDFVFLKDELLVLKDSLISIRFANLSFGSNPISINLQGSQATPIVSNIAYKGVTTFFTFPAKAKDPVSGRYVFEIRDLTAAKLIATYTLTPLNTRLFRNLTLALRGQQGGTGTKAQGALLINNY